MRSLSSEGRFGSLVMRPERVAFWLADESGALVNFVETAAPSSPDGRGASIDVPLVPSPALRAGFQRDLRSRPTRGVLAQPRFSGRLSLN